MKTEYEALMEAALVLESAKTAISREDGSYTSPAWKLVYRAQYHVTEMANAILRAPLLDALYEVRDLIDGYVDVSDGDYGIPVANKAMRAVQRIDEAIAEAESNSHV